MDLKEIKNFIGDDIENNNYYFNLDSFKFMLY
jgi:hypothetical protein